MHRFCDCLPFTGDLQLLTLIFAAWSCKFAFAMRLPSLDFRAAGILTLLVHLYTRFLHPQRRWPNSHYGNWLPDLPTYIACILSNQNTSMICNHLKPPFCHVVQVFELRPRNYLLITYDSRSLSWRGVYSVAVCVHYPATSEQVSIYLPTWYTVCSMTIGAASPGLFLAVAKTDWVMHHVIKIVASQGGYF